MRRINRAWIERHRNGKPKEPPAAEALLASANATAGNARNLFVTYILLSVYVFLTVGATNDEQLFRDAGVAVPFLSNINLPVSKFYQFVPWMFLFVHVDLLLLFQLLGDKLHAFNAELDRLPEESALTLRRQLAVLPFVHWLAGERGDRIGHAITGLVVWSTLLALPLLTLLALQIGFLPYHSAATTFLQRVALVLDTLALAWFWPRLAAGTPQSAWRWWLPFGAGRPAACRGLCRTASLALLAGSVGFGTFVAVLPGERLEDDGVLAHRLHRNLDLHEKLLVANEPDLETLSKLQESGTEGEGLRTLLVKVKGLDLQGRDLRFAKLEKAKLWRADLRGARLQGAKLSETQLQSADLREAELDGVDLRGAGLQGVDLEKAPSQGAASKGAQLQGVDLGEAQLQGANLEGAQLQGANLEGAELQGANLEGAELQGADLRGAQLQGADLRKAEMQGANLREARLQGADLWGAQLQGTNMWEAQIGSASFAGAKLEINDFRNLNTTLLFGNDDLEGWKAHVRSRLKDKERAKQREKWMESRVERPTEFSPEGIAAPCLAESPRSAPFERCQDANPDYFEALAQFLGELACDGGKPKPKEEKKNKVYIAKGVAAHRKNKSYEWGAEGAAAHRRLARRLWQEDCTDEEGVVRYLRTKLRKFAKGSESPPPAAGQRKMP